MEKPQQTGNLKLFLLKELRGNSKLLKKILKSVPLIISMCLVSAMLLYVELLLRITSLFQTMHIGTIYGNQIFRAITSYTAMTYVVGLFSIFYGLFCVLWGGVVSIFIIHLSVTMPVFVHGVPYDIHSRFGRFHKIISRNFIGQLKLPIILAIIILIRFLLPIVTRTESLTLDGLADFYYYFLAFFGSYVLIHEAVYWRRLSIVKNNLIRLNSILLSRAAFLRYCYSVLGFIVVIIFIVWVFLPVFVGGVNKTEAYLRSPEMSKYVFGLARTGAEPKTLNLSEKAFGLNGLNYSISYSQWLDTVRRYPLITDKVIDFTKKFLGVMLRLTITIMLIQLLVKIILNLSVNTGPREFYRRITASLVKSFAIGFGAPLICQVVFWQTDADPFTMTNVFATVFSFIIFSAGEALRASD